MPSTSPSPNLWDRLPEPATDHKTQLPAPVLKKLGNRSTETADAALICCHAACCELVLGLLPERQTEIIRRSKYGHEN